MKSFLSSKCLPLLAVFALLRAGFQLNGSVDANATYNPLDIGAVYNCTIPANLTFCSINYPVPESVAALATVWEALILNEYKDYENRLESVNCLAEVRELLCARYFPVCYLDEEVVNMLVPDECLPSCQTGESCDFEFAANSSLGDCKPVSDYAKKYNYNFTVCGDDAEKRYVTEWMFHYLRRQDQELETISNLLQSLCLPDFFRFKCEEIGRCWNQGKRIELSQNRTACNRLRTFDCFDSHQLNVVEDELACEGYPDVTPLTTEATDITPSAPTYNNTNTTAVTTSPITSFTLTAAPGQSNSSPETYPCLLMLNSLLILCTVAIRMLV